MENKHFVQNNNTISELDLRNSKRNNKKPNHINLLVMKPSHINLLKFKEGLERMHTTISLLL